MKKIALSIILLSISLIMTGCWQYTELNDLSIVAALGIDKEGSDYLLSVQIIDVRKQSKNAAVGDETPVTVFEAKGKTLGEALNKISLEVPHQLYFQHIDMVIIGEETAKIGIREYIDFLLRDRDVRKMYPVIIAKDANAIDVLKILTPIETLPSVNLIGIISTSQKESGYSAKKSFEDLLECLYIDGRHPGLPAVEIIGTVEDGEESDNISETIPKAKLIVQNIAVLRDDKLVGYIKDDAALGYNTLRQRVKSSVISFPCDGKGNYGSVKIDAPKLTLKTKLKDQKPSADIKVELTATLTDYNCDLDIKNAKNIEKIEKMVDKKMYSIIETAIKETQNYEADIFGFGEYLYQNDYKNWEKIKREWDKLYKNMSYKIKIKSRINNTGSITTPAKQGGEGSE